MSFTQLLSSQIQEKKNHKRALAAMQFLGELFVIKGVSGKTVIRCLTELRGEEDNADEENLEVCPTQQIYN